MTRDSSTPDFGDICYRERFTPWDAGRVPMDPRSFAASLDPGVRILVPGCRSAHDVYYLAENRFEVLAVDFSAEAVALPQRNLGCAADAVRMADFFTFDPASESLAVFGGGERWQVWKRRHVNAR